MSEIVEAGHGPIPVTEGEWAGWSFWQSDAFEQTAGPFYERREDNGDWVCAFRTEDRHMNGGGFLHGGCLMTFADAALFTIARGEMHDSFGVTMNLSGDFLNPAKPGQLVEARGEVTRGGGKTVFVRGIATADGTPILSFTGIIRKTGKRPSSLPA
ncbi:PaaI family thioesterase [Alteriqipengyuania flavescens]|uniref:PaaI family thioesterase n=1 Tax=Alteriqipengyuania flavescens TaxID=3053610 RepID=UPI0025B3C4EE|nr:PaaI family thioesterase [Alteriqipengyuania flavescens]WJY18427.1 PaaI family thioesterase [Alteriqipengyuania flavescens]WJY24368.1 PaaI family thioesterase [Alteriqipengyuania flavescens]